MTSATISEHLEHAQLLLVLQLMHAYVHIKLRAYLSLLSWPGIHYSTKCTYLQWMPHTRSFRMRMCTPQLALFLSHRPVLIACTMPTVQFWLLALCQLSSVWSLALCQLSSVWSLALCQLSSFWSLALCQLSSFWSLALCQLSSFWSLALCSPSSFWSLAVCNTASDEKLDGGKAW